MKYNKLVISKDKIKRKEFLKTEFKKLILKSIFQNFKISDMCRIDAFRKLVFLKKKSSISYQNNICLISGRIGGVFNKWHISRHNIKVLGKFNMLHNVKINSW
jgi:ribosomal protein S14